jgi:carbamoyl-phosphate synthase large subunit
VTISKFVEGADEVELDGVAADGRLHVSAISEHVEQAGVHSGDATIVYPVQRLSRLAEQRIRDIGAQLVAALQISGPFNIQFLVKGKQVSVIEMNVRASRTFPLLSKATGVNFAGEIVKAIYGQGQLRQIGYPDYVVVKAPQFSFSRLSGVDPVLRVEMASTGEAACFGRDLEEAFLKAMLSVEALIPEKGVFVSLGELQQRIALLPHLLSLSSMQVPFYGTERTAAFLKHNGVATRVLYKIHEGKRPTVLDYFKQGKIDLAINIAERQRQEVRRDEFVIRRAAIDHHIQLITNYQLAVLFIKAITSKKLEDLEIKPWREYG